MKKRLTLFLSMLSLLLIGSLVLSLNPVTAQQPNSSTAPKDHVIAAAKEVFNASATALLIQDMCPWGCCSNESALAAVGISYDLVNSQSLQGIDLCKYHFVMYASDQPQSYYDNIAVNIDKISAYVHDCCGLLIAHACDQGWGGGLWRNILPGGVGHQFYATESAHITDPSHCVVNGLDDTFFSGWGHTVHGYFTNLQPGTNVVMVVANNELDMPTYIDYQYGQGRVWASMHTAEWGYTGCGCWAGDRSQFLLNELKCARDFECDNCCETVLEVVEKIRREVAAIEGKNDVVEVKLDRLGRAVSVIEAKNDKMEVKLDNLGKLDGRIDSLIGLLKKLQYSVDLLEAKMDRPNVR